MATRLRIKMGQIEFEYEGEAGFSSDEIKDLVTHFETLVRDQSAEDAEQTADAASHIVQELPAEGTDTHPNSVASHLGVKSGPELVIAAFAYLQIHKGQKTVSRADILPTMQSATAYYNKNMGSNLTASLKNLVKAKKINQVTEKDYSLTNGERTRVEAAIAQAA